MVPRKIKFKEMRESHYQVYKWYMKLKSWAVIFNWWGQMISRLESCGHEFSYDQNQNYILKISVKFLVKRNSHKNVWFFLSNSLAKFLDS